MIQGVITTKQLQHHRDIARQITELRDRWNDVLAWYPKEQNKHYAHYGDVYKESRNTYGEEQFQKFAQKRRLRGIHTVTRDTPKMKSDKKRSCYPVHYMDSYKPSPTTNGEYGLISPAHHHGCLKGNFVKVRQCEKFT